MLISISSIHQPTLDTQRGRLDASRVQYYMQLEEIRDTLVYENPTNLERIPVNGHHRIESARRLGWTHIDADVRPGTRQDASKYRDLGPRRPWSEIERECSKGRSLEE